MLVTANDLTRTLGLAFAAFVGDVPTNNPSVGAKMALPQTKWQIPQIRKMHPHLFRLATFQHLLLLVAGSHITNSQEFSRDTSKFLHFKSSSICNPLRLIKLDSSAHLPWQHVSRNPIFGQKVDVSALGNIMH